MESCGVSLNYKLRIIEIGDELPLAIRLESAIEIVVLRILSY